MPVTVPFLGVRQYPCLAFILVEILTHLTEPVLIRDAPVPVLDLQVLAVGQVILRQGFQKQRQLFRIFEICRVDERLLRELLVVVDPAANYRQDVRTVDVQLEEFLCDIVRAETVLKRQVEPVGVHEVRNANLVKDFARLPALAVDVDINVFLVVKYFRRDVRREGR